MPKYLISRQESQWTNLIIDAPSQLAALDKFYNQEYNMEDIAVVGQEMIPDTIDIEEIEGVHAQDSNCTRTNTCRCMILQITY